MTQNNQDKSIKDRIINPSAHVGDLECKLCYGKGYSSELTGQSWGSDLGVGNPGREDILNMKPCKCIMPKSDTSKCKPLPGDCECRHQKKLEPPEPKSWEDFEEWNREVGLVTPRTSTYYELKSIFEEAVQEAYERGKREAGHEALGEAAEALYRRQNEVTMERRAEAEGSLGREYLCGYEAALVNARDLVNVLLSNQESK